MARVALAVGDEALLDRWRAATRTWDADPDVVRACGLDLLCRYREPHRRYHTVEHLAAVVGWLEGASAPPPAIVAGWFHDAVYQPGAPAGENERASARLAVDALGRVGVPEADVAEVSRLVELTAGHRVSPEDGNGQLVVAADLAILSASSREYGRYRSGVRAEYAHLDDDDWSRGRSAVLRSLLGRVDLDTDARANVGLELAALSASTG